MEAKFESALILLHVCLVIVWTFSPAQCDQVKEIEAAARSFIAQMVSVPCDSLGITIDLPEISDVNITSYTFDLYSNRPVVGTVPFKVIANVGGKQQAFTATARVRIFKKVAVAARRLGRHEIIDRDDVRLEKRDITFLTDGYFEDRDSAAGKRTRRVINAGSILASSDVEDLPIVERGADVMVSVIIGSVTVTAKARALEDGAIGDRIVVRDLTTGKRLTVTVVGKGLAVLEKTML